MTKYLDNNYDLNSKELIEVIDEVPFWSAPFGLKLLDAIHYKKGITALDIGFGAGFPLTEIAIRLGESSKIYGIDPWKAAIERAKKKIKVYGLNNVELICGETEKIPLQDKSIDLIISNNGLNNVDAIEKALTECSRIIKPGGQFLQTVNMETTMIEFYQILKNTLTETGHDNMVKKIDEHIYEKRKPLDVYLKMIENCGFTIKSVNHHEFHYTYVDGTAMLNAYFIRLAFLDSWKKLVPAQKQKELFSAVEEKMNKEAEKQGCFKLSVPFVVIDAKR